MIKSYKSLRNAAIAGVAGFTAAASILGSALPAHAVNAATTVTVVSGTPTTIHPGATAQPAANETLTTSATGTVYTVGDKITFQVDDKDGGNCALSGDTIGFNGTPVVTVTAPTTGTRATFTGATSSSLGACTTAGVKDLFTLTVATSGTADTIVVSGIKYDVGTAVAPGAVTVNVTAASSGTGTLTASPAATPPGTATPTTSNATISATLVTADNPPTAVTAGGAGQAVSPVTVQEFQPGTVTGPLCLAIQSGNATFTLTNTPTASASGGGAATGTPAQTATTITVPVTTKSTATPATFTIGNIKLDVGTTQGPVTATVRDGDCATGTLLGTVALTNVTSVTRFGGTDRYDTARLIALNSFNCAQTVVIARGDLFPDALAGNFVAGRLGAPILLTMTDSVPSSTLAALKSLGARNVIILGQTQAVDTNAENQLKATPTYNCPSGTPRTNPFTGNPINMNVTRIGGATRYDTAQLVAESQGLNPGGTLTPNGASAGTPIETAILSSGENFPDALAAGPMAYRGTNVGSNGDQRGFPLLLTSAATLSPQAQQGISDLNVKQVIVTGGDNAIAPSVRTALTSQGINVILLAGPTRMGTAAVIAGFETATPSGAGTSAAVNGLGYDKTHANLARGDDFADALSGGPHAGSELGGTPILLTQNPTTLSNETESYLKSHSAVAMTGGLTSLHIFGGPVAITPAVAQQAANDIS